MIWSSNLVPLQLLGTDACAVIVVANITQMIACENEDCAREWVHTTFFPPLLFRTDT